MKTSRIVIVEAYKRGAATLQDFVGVKRICAKLSR